MARSYFGVEYGIRIYEENSFSSFAEMLFGTAAPGGDAGQQDDAAIGSLYLRSNGELYTKIADTNAASDWELKASGVISAPYVPANGTVTAGDTFQDAIEKLDGNQLDLISLSGVAQGSVDLGTFTGVTISDSNTIKGALQELETAHEEVDQNVNDLITLSGVAENSSDLGTFTGVTISDANTIKGALQELETAHEEVDQNVNDLITLSGVAENATDLGTFTGAIISDNTTVKNALQELETFVENIEGGSPIIVSGVTTLQDIDTILVDNVHCVEWEIVAWEEAVPSNKVFLKITALHDGTASADAANVDDTAHTKLKVGSNFDINFSVDLNGTGVSQAMRLRASSGTAGVAMEVRRTGVLVNS